MLIWKEGSVRKVGEGWEHLRGRVCKNEEIFYINHNLIPSVLDENVKIHRKIPFQTCSYFLSFQGEDWCLSYQQKDQLLENVKKCLPGMFDVLDVNEASPGLPVNEQPHWCNILS